MSANVEITVTGTNPLCIGGGCNQHLCNLIGQHCAAANCSGPAWAGPGAPGGTWDRIHTWDISYDWQHIQFVVGRDTADGDYKGYFVVINHAFSVNDPQRSTWISDVKVFGSTRPDCTTLDLTLTGGSVSHPPGGALCTWPATLDLSAKVESANCVRDFDCEECETWAPNYFMVKFTPDSLVDNDCTECDFYFTEQNRQVPYLSDCNYERFDVAALCGGGATELDVTWTITFVQNGADTDITVTIFLNDNVAGGGTVTYKLTVTGPDCLAFNELEIPFDSIQINSYDPNDACTGWSAASILLTSENVL